MRPRRASEAGHSRKFLVVIDESPECARAAVYAAKRAARTGGGLAMLYVIEPGDFQHWLGAEDIRRAEAMEEADEILHRYSDMVREASNIEAEVVIREGRRADEVINAIDEDEDISVLVLGASEASEGPGPLISAIAGKGSSIFPIPVTIVPGTLSDEAMDAIA
ncbi:MAG: universal stress protein [Alphaproteobacteria bacterium]